MEITFEISKEDLQAQNWEEINVSSNPRSKVQNVWNLNVEKLNDLREIYSSITTL